jgi:UDP-N-acetylmuramoyl-L-alanyl-D-glutamate--2,6-diaminopimelate ligase
MTAGLRLDELVRELPGIIEIVGDANVRVVGVQQDSRRVQQGDLFVARKGAHADGATFAEDAARRGAVAVLVGRAEVASLGADLPRIVVDDVAVALAHAAAAVYGHPAFGLEIVGVTGTNGKTTTTHLLRAAIDGAVGEACCGIVGTVGHRFRDLAMDAAHTTPEADELARVLAAMKRRGATHVAMEVSSIALASNRVRAVRFRVAALTNLTQDHLDYHGSMQAYGDAKAELFTSYAPGSAVINVDDPFGQSLVARVRAPVVRVSRRTSATSQEADVAPVSATFDAAGIHAVVRTPGGEVKVTSRLVGAHNLENLVVTLGIVHALDLDVKRAAEALATEAGAPGRLERCDAVEDDVAVLVDYAHTPDAVARALDAVRPSARGRVWCVFGCGGDRDVKKRAPMGEAVAQRADVAIITNDNPRSERPEAIAAPIQEGARSGGMRLLETLGGREHGYLVELDRARAIEGAILAAEKGDLILVAGKGHEDYQIVGTEKRTFDDRIEARRALTKRRTQMAENASKATSLEHGH